MASIEPRKNKQGQITSYRVVWRDKGRKQARSLKNKKAAYDWKHLIEATQGDTKRAERKLLSSLSDSPKLSKVAGEHIERLINVQPFTLKTYKTYTRMHLGDLGDLPIDSITEDDLIRWTRSMLDKGRSAKTIKNVHGFISAVFNGAMRRDLVEKNPCGSRYLPKKDHATKGIQFLSLDDFEFVLSEIPGHYHNFFRFLLETGLRLSEAAALTPEDFILDGPVPSVRVTKAWKRGAKGNEVTLATPKTIKGIRTVSLARATVERMRPHLERVGYGELVFVMNQGNVITPTRLHANVWQNAIKRAQERGLRFKPRVHDLRHTHASLMIAGGANLFDLADRLGHESVQTTTSVYGHLVPGALREAAAIADQAFERPASPAELTTEGDVIDEAEDEQSK